MIVAYIKSKLKVVKVFEINRDFQKPPLKHFHRKAPSQIFDWVPNKVSDITEYIRHFAKSGKVRNKLRKNACKYIYIYCSTVMQRENTLAYFYLYWKLYITEHSCYFIAVTLINQARKCSNIFRFVFYLAIIHDNVQFEQTFREMYPSELCIIFY